MDESTLERTHERTWYIYVARPTAGNFDIGLQKGIWGMSQEGAYDDIMKGDAVTFVHALQGSLRVKSDAFLQSPRVADRIVRAIATSDGYNDTSPIWPDGAYPARFLFEIVDDRRGVELQSELSSEAMEAVRHAANQYGRAYPVEEQGRALPNHNPAHFWVEKTHVNGRVDRGQGAHRFGNAIWGPVSSYGTFMESIATGDIVLHFQDEGNQILQAFVATSRDRGVLEKMAGLPDTPWEDKECYRREVSEFRPLEPPLYLSDLRQGPFADQLLELHRRLMETPPAHLFYNVTRIPFEALRSWTTPKRSRTTLTPTV